MFATFVYQTSSANVKVDKLFQVSTFLAGLFEHESYGSSVSYLSSDFSSRVHLGADLDEGRSHAEVLQQLSADVL